MTIPETLRQASEALQQASAALVATAKAMEDAPGAEPAPEPEPGEWRNDREPTSGEQSGDTVWAWYGRPMGAMRRTICTMYAAGERPYWAPGNRPAPKSPPPDVVASQGVEPAPQPGEWRSMPAPSEDDAGSDGKVWAWVSGQPATRLHWHNARHLMLCKRLSFWAPGNRPAPTSPPLVSMTDGRGAKAEPALPPDVVGSREPEPQPEAPPKPDKSRTGGWIVDRVPTQADADRDEHVLVPSRNGSRGTSLVHFLSVFPGTPWGTVNAIADPWDPTCLDRNGWIRSRLPTVEDANGVGVVLIPVGRGGTTSTINYHLIVPGQPWAPWGSNPGGFEK